MLSYHNRLSLSFLVFFFPLLFNPKYPNSDLRFLHFTVDKNTEDREKDADRAKMKVVEEEGLARKFWIKFESHFVLTMYTPFFLSLAAGSLKTDTFLHCISQDVHFLNAFARAYDLAEECADDEDDKAAIRKLRKRVNQKLKMNDTLVREWGFELPKESITNDAAVKYTDFLGATALGKVEGERALKIETPFEKIKIAAYILGAISPFMRMVAVITKEIQALLDPDDSSHIYKKWIDSYCSQDFEVAALQTEELLDKLSVSLTGEELEVIEKLYHQAMKLEAAFFATLPIERQTLVPLSQVQDPVEGRLTIFCDFDLTCAAFDSSAILAEIAILTAKRADPDQNETKLTRMSSADLRSAWDVLSTKYTEEYEQCIESIMPSEAVGKFDYGSLCEALKQLADFERTANSRVGHSGVLKGINLEDVKRTGEHLILQDGCRGFFQKTVGRENFKADVHILSYCWCGDLIRSAFSSGDLHGLRVHSNELVYEESISTGEIVKKLESPLEKLQVFNDILKHNNNDDQHLTVYIGGKLGDLLCLLEADIGIVMGSSSSLRRVGDQFGVSFVPLFSGLVEKQREVSNGGSFKWNKLSGTLYTVSSWAEIHALILGS